MANSQIDKAHAFRALHQKSEIFVIGNAWDAGSTRLLAGLGYKAIATSSGAAANTLGRRDGQITRDEAMDHCSAIAGATDLPVSADLESRFSADAAGVAETIRLATATGFVGGSIEDATAIRPNRSVPSKRRWRGLRRQSVRHGSWRSHSH